MKESLQSYDHLRLHLLRQHLDTMDSEAFERHFAHLPTSHELYDEIGVIFVTTPEDDAGDHCFIEERRLYLILHVAPSTEAMIQAFENSYLEPVTG